MGTAETPGGSLPEPALESRFVRAERLIADPPVESLDDYLGRGGGEALLEALSVEPQEVIDLVKASGLRGRGGAGFPTGVKWAGIAGDHSAEKFLVCNGAEGEPATFKDRFLIRRNPYQLIEGLMIAAYATGVDHIYIGLKARFKQEIAALERALEEMDAADILGFVPIDLRFGPDEYLFGEERALLEVIEGREPMPRVMPPYMDGLFTSPGSHNPVVANNVESIFNVPQIVLNGPEWFRSVGTERSPGTMVFTLVGDVQRPGVYELPLGTPLGSLIYDYGGGPHPGHEIKAVLPGSSHPVVTPAHFDTPLDYDSMTEIGSGLGTGFAVFDDTACMVRVAQLYLRFLHIESCGQCNPCKLHSASISGVLSRIEEGQGKEGDVEEILRGSRMVTDGQRCYLPSATSLLAQSMVRVFVGEFAAHLEHACSLPREIVLPKLVDFDESTGEFTYDERYRLKRPDWTYAEG
ncbi:MAG: complex I 51 kDa subunit family protein [Actinomycetota bacterium]